MGERIVPDRKVPRSDDGYLRSLDGHGYHRVSDELQSRFSHLGRTGA